MQRTCREKARNTNPFLCLLRSLAASRPQFHGGFAPLRLCVKKVASSIAGERHLTQRRKDSAYQFKMHLPGLVGGQSGRGAARLKKSASAAAKG
jgi:hypothetical protein